jgi:hypothetical protein
MDNPATEHSGAKFLSSHTAVINIKQRAVKKHITPECTAVTNHTDHTASQSP